MDTLDPMVAQKMPDLSELPVAATPTPETRVNLVGLARDELVAELATIGAEKFRAQQLWQWQFR